MTPHELAEELAERTHITVLTGAGLSAPSGISTFRSPEGVSHQVGNRTMEELSSASTWKKHPDLTWAYYMNKMSAIKASKPNAGHHALAKMQERKTVELFTQNLDDYHELAGSNPVHHFHGAVHRFECTFCGADVPADQIDYSSTTCAWHDCGYRIRPSITLFEEPMPEAPVDAIEKLLKTKRTEALLVVGTSLNVSPVNMFPLFAMDQSIPVFEVNLHPTQFSDMFTGFVRGTADRTLPLMVDRLLSF